MSKELFGSESASQVLLFLLVNEEGYAQQMHQVLQLPLTPIQKALQRLESSSVLVSERERKRRVYRFNQESPLSASLGTLLKELFQQLPAKERRRYFAFAPVGGVVGKSQAELLRQAWKGLKGITRVKLISDSKTTPSWNGSGAAEVSVNQEGNSLILEEEGKWLGAQNYRNALRWTYHKFDGRLSLEHLRFGKERPVFLFDLVPSKPNLLKSASLHLCAEDSYFGWLQVHDLYLHLHIRTLGPSKNEKIESIYM